MYVHTVRSKCPANYSLSASEANGRLLFVTTSLRQNHTSDERNEGQGSGSKTLEAGKWPAGLHVCWGIAESVACKDQAIRHFGASSRLQANPVAQNVCEVRMYVCTYIHSAAA